MCRKLLFSGMVVLAASTAVLAQGFVPSYGQQSFFIGASGTSANHSGSVGFDAGTDFTTGKGGDYYQACGPCTSIKSSQTNSGFIDQGAAVGGCGGSRGACDFMVGGGAQSQSTTYLPARCTPTCTPITNQFQAIGGVGVNDAFNTCGTGGAAAGQAGAATEFQSRTTPASGGSQYQHIAGTQAAVATGAPTSYASAGGIIGGGGIQCQSFGGLPVAP